MSKFGKGRCAKCGTQWDECHWCHSPKFSDRIRCHQSTHLCSSHCLLQHRIGLGLVRNNRRIKQHRITWKATT